MDVERHRRILETILTRAKDEEDVVKRLSNYMALLHYCYEEAEEVRGYFTLALEEKGLDTLQIASLVNRAGKRYASTRLTAKAEKRLAEVQARLDRGETPDSYAYELFASLEEIKAQEAGNPLLTPIQVHQARRTVRMMRAVRSLFKAAKVVGLALVPGFILHKVSAASTAGAAGGVTASATAGVMASGSAIAAPAGAGLAAVIPIAAGAAEAVAPIAAPIAGKVVAGWVATGLFFGASGVVAYEATTGEPVVPSTSQTAPASAQEPSSDHDHDHDPEPFPWTDPSASETPPVHAYTPTPELRVTRPSESPDPRPTKQMGTAMPTIQPTTSARASASVSATSTPTPPKTPPEVSFTPAPQASPTLTSTPTPTSPPASPTATPVPMATPTGIDVPGDPQIPSEGPTGTPEPSPTVTNEPMPTPTPSATETGPPGPTSEATGPALMRWFAELLD
ncbi:hypothetical protein [Nonomuraea rubra]|uniref:hypothetical protein n=1 Tax=Nonomuraea rubra TaxID=46180 RepID=UPI0033C5CB8D